MTFKYKYVYYFPIFLLNITIIIFIIIDLYSRLGPNLLYNLTVRLYVYNFSIIM